MGSPWGFRPRPSSDHPEKSLGSGNGTWATPQRVRSLETELLIAALERQTLGQLALKSPALRFQVFLLFLRCRSFSSSVEGGRVSKVSPPLGWVLLPLATLATLLHVRRARMSGSIVPQLLRSSFLSGRIAHHLRVMVVFPFLLGYIRKPCPQKETHPVPHRTRPTEEGTRQVTQICLKYGGRPQVRHRVRQEYYCISRLGPEHVNQTEGHRPLRRSGVLRPGGAHHTEP